MLYRSILSAALAAGSLGTLTASGSAADVPPAAPATPAAPAKPVLKIIPGKVIVPTDNMRRPWGEVISLDPATRTGKFRKDGTQRRKLLGGSA